MKNKDLSTWAWVFGGLGVVVMSWFLFSLIPEHLNPYSIISLDKASKIGDFIGGFVGVLFSIAAFFLLYETLNTQRVEINENRKLILKQSFENNFFQMTSMLNDFIKEIDIQKSQVISDPSIQRDEQIIAKGRDCFKYIYDNIYSTNCPESKMNDKVFFEDKFNKMLSMCYSDLNHYFEYSLEIIKYIDSFSKKDSLSNAEALTYMNLFYSSLSCYEELLLFYFVIFKDTPTIINIVKSYAFFKSIRTDKLIHKNHLAWL